MSLAKVSRLLETSIDKLEELRLKIKRDIELQDALYTESRGFIRDVFYIYLNEPDKKFETAYIEIQRDQIPPIIKDILMVGIFISDILEPYFTVEISEKCTFGMFYSVKLQFKRKIT